MFDSIFGNLGAASSHRSQAKIHQANARVSRAQASAARAQGCAAKAQAYGQASRLERENQVAGRQTVDNMERLREAGTKARGSAQAARGASGFTAEGSGKLAEVSVLDSFEQEAADMAYSRSLQDTSARFNAAMMRRSGDIAERGAEINAMQYEASAQYDEAQASVSKQMARNANTSAAINAAFTAIGAAIGFAGVGSAGSGGGFSGAFKGASIGSGIGQMGMSGLPGTWESQAGGNSGDQGRAMAYIGDTLSKFFK